MSAKSTLSPQFVAAQRKRLEALKAELLGADSAAQKETREGQEDGGADAVSVAEPGRPVPVRGIAWPSHPELPGVAHRSNLGERG